MNKKIKKLFPITSKKEKETIKLGRDIGKLLRGGEVIGIKGNLGSGKTTLIKGIAESLQVKETIDSPTFSLINEYQGVITSGKKVDVLHLDLYRLESESAVWELGFYDELFCLDKIFLIEWADKLPFNFPMRGNYFLVHIIVNENKRIFKFKKGTDDNFRN